MNLEPIDTSTTAGKARVMQLASEGRKVAQRSSAHAEPFVEQARPDWNWRVSEYAIIAEPVGPEEVWVLVNEFAQCMDVTAKESRFADVGDNGRAVRYIRADLAGRDE